MPITTVHPEYSEVSPRWRLMSDALSDEDKIKSRGTLYLPKTGGMAKGKNGDARYETYKDRARFPEITSQALTATIGLVFEKDPIGATDEIITNTEQTNLQLARDVVRQVASKGRSILVVDSKTEEEGGGVPYITQYSAESLINWKVSSRHPSELEMAVFAENVDVSTDEYGHDFDRVYRKYKRIDSGISVTLWDKEGALIDAERIISIDTMPIIPVGSIDLTPRIDPIPLLPIARCALGYYRKSANFEQALHLSAQPTPWVKGITAAQYEELRAIGTGAAALWYLGSDSIGEAGFLEFSGDGVDKTEAAMLGELKQAESYAIRLTQQAEGTESGAAIAMRAATQHASVYSIADAVSIGIARAQRIRAKWAGVPEAGDFALRTEFTENYSGEQMINALNSAVNSNNAPRSALFEAIRKSGLSESTDDEMVREIENSGG